MPLQEEDKKLLNEIQNGLAEEVETVTADKATELQERGVEFKENTPEETTPAETEKVTVDPNAVLEQLKVALNLEGLVEAVKVELAKLNDKIDQVDNRVKQVEQDEDSKIAAIYQPNWQKAFAAATVTTPQEKSEEAEAKKEALKGWDIEPNQIFWGNAFNKS